MTKEFTCTVLSPFCLRLFCMVYDGVNWMLWYSIPHYRVPTFVLQRFPDISTAYFLHTWLKPVITRTSFMNTCSLLPSHANLRHSTAMRTPIPSTLVYRCIGNVQLWYSFCFYSYFPARMRFELFRSQVTRDSVLLSTADQVKALCSASNK